MSPKSEDEENRMTPSTLAGAVFATGVWAAFTVAILGGAQLNPQTQIWVSTASEKVATHPTLVRAAYPVVTTAAHPRI
jgi:hypothetical protein